jgi:hypothetical protein
MQIHRPGPASIDPATAPGGIVMHCYSVPDEELLLVQYLTPDCDIEAVATAGGDVAAAHEGNVCLVAFDGDTGLRLGPHDWLAGLMRGFSA